MNNNIEFGRCLVIFEKDLEKFVSSMASEGI